MAAASASAALRRRARSADLALSSAALSAALTTRSTGLGGSGGLTSGLGRLLRPPWAGSGGFGGLLASGQPRRLRRRPWLQRRPWPQPLQRRLGGGFGGGAGRGFGGFAGQALLLLALAALLGQFFLLLADGVGLGARFFLAALQFELVGLGPAGLPRPLATHRHA
jgi:hypothetical protein